MNFCHKWTQILTDADSEICVSSVIVCGWKLLRRFFHAAQIQLAGKIRCCPPGHFCKILLIKTLALPIGKARSEVCALVKKVQAGARITLSSHGRRAAVLVPPEKPKKPWRVAVPSDPKLLETCNRR
jgi:prevent-host-death family protein